MEQIISQKKALEIIKDYIKQHGYPPTNRELAKEFCCALSTANMCLREMLNAGLLETDHPAGACRALRVPGMRVVDTKELEGAVKQITDLLDHCRDMAAGRDADPIWDRDVKALETVIEGAERGDR
jgi:DNA-binding transcriptional regulator YhcF (GntR family)